MLSIATLLWIATFANAQQATPVCVYSLSSREMMQLDPEKGDKIISFIALKVNCSSVSFSNITGIQREPMPIFGLMCKDGLIWSAKEQGCGRCPRKNQLTIQDKARLKKKGQAHVERCFQDGPGGDSCVCDIQVKKTNKRGRTVWRRKRLNNVKLYVKPKCKYDRQIKAGAKPQCYEYQSLATISLMPNKLQSWVFPQLKCGGGLGFSRLKDMLPVYLAPSTSKDAPYHMMRFFTQFGFETELDILQTIPLQNNIAWMLFPHTVETGGVSSHVGPSLSEVESCKMKMNLFVDRRGHAILNNRPIDLSKIPVNEPICGADQIEDLTTSYDESLALLKSIRNSSMSCQMEGPEGPRKLRAIFDRRLEENCVVKVGDGEESSVLNFGSQEGHCCKAFAALSCSERGTCRELGFNSDRLSEEETGQQGGLACSECHHSMVQGLVDSSANDNANKYIIEEEVRDGRFRFCDQSGPNDQDNNGERPLPETGPRELPKGNPNECKLGDVIYLGELQAECCAAVRTVFIAEMMSADVDYLIPEEVEPDHDENINAWRAMCVDLDQCSKSVLKALMKYQAAGGTIIDPETNEEQFHPDVNLHVVRHMDKNGDGIMDGCDRIVEHTESASCGQSIKRAVDTDSNQCLQTLTGRSDGKFLTTCTKSRQLHFNETSSDCKSWICESYLESIFSQCSSSPQLICCGAGNSDALLEYCPALADQYASLCPNGCERPMDCHSCHQSCDSCIDEQNSYICHIRCDYEECGAGDPKEEWRLYDGMPCHRQRDILERTMGAALQRAFLFTAMDTYSGCKNLLNSWTNTTNRIVTETITGCSVPERDEYGQLNQQWVEDACCNHEMRRKQCCAPRLVNVTKPQLTVNTEMIGLYDALTGAGQLALQVAQSYSEATNSASRECFKPFKQFMNQTQNAHQYMERCWRDVNGDDYERKHGVPCKDDSECWTEKCILPKSEGSETSTQKYCAIPLDTEEGDSAVPLMNCLLSQSVPEVTEYFKYQLGLNQSADTASVARAMIEFFPDITNAECQGREHGFWMMKTKEDCEKAQQCNWNWNKQGDSCTDPCAFGSASCPNFCGTLTDKSESSRFPTCRIRMDSGGYHHVCWQEVEEERRITEQNCQQCNHNCEQTREESCWGNCEAGVCAGLHDWAAQYNKFEACFDAKCQALNVNYRAFSVDYDVQCIDVTKSFSGDKKDACMGDCHGADGPQPHSTERCFANLDPETATQGTCHKLGEAWIEERFPHLEHWEWDWSRGMPAPKYCWLRGYEVLDNKPYIRPPPFGYACPLKCEKELNQCFHQEKCWQWFESKQMNRMDICHNIFEKDRKVFDECVDSKRASCKGVDDCRENKRQCRDSTGLSRNKEFDTMECASCQGEWTSHEDFQYQCLASVSMPECRWNSSAASQTCAWGCMDTCWREFEKCDKADKRECETDIRKLNQCRECVFVHCDEQKCQHKCDSEHFGWWQDPENSCLGCDASFTCSPGKDCFQDRKCFGEKPPFGENCPFNCEQKLERCREDKRKHCYEKLGERNYEDTCHKTYQLIARSMHKCIEGKERMSSEPCWENGSCEKQRKTFLLTCRAEMDVASLGEFSPLWNTSLDTNCYDCHGEWNMHDPWQFEHNVQCITETNCAENCLPTTCDRFDISCWALMEQERNCTHKEVEGRGEWREVCKKTFADASRSVMDAHLTCSGCEFLRCDHECRYSCEREAGEVDRHSFWSAREVSERCGACTLNQKIARWTEDTALCAPTAPCFIQKSFNWSDTESPSAEFWDAENECFGEGKTRRLEVSEVSAEKRALMSGAIERMTAKSREDYLYHLLLMAERAGGNASKSLKSRRLARHPEWVTLDECKTADECNAARNLCQAFWERDAPGAEVSDIQKQINTVLDSSVPWTWAAAPWENSDRQCEELGQICFLGLDQAAVMAQDKKREECEDWANEPWLQECLTNRCAGCTDASSTDCDHCCQCHSDATIRHAAGEKMHGKGNYWCPLVARTYEAELAANDSTLNLGQYRHRRWEMYHDLPISEIHYRDNLLNGAGACVHHINHEQVKLKAHGENCRHESWRPECSVTLSKDNCATSDFKFYQVTTEWKKGVLATEEECEAAVCDPEPWITSQEKCEKVNYCRGECWYCDTRDFWNWESSQSKIMCTFTKANGADLTKDECTEAGNAAGEGESGTVFTENNKTGRGICQTEPPSTATGSTTADKCRGTRVVTILAEETEFFFTVLSCKDFTRSECGWAGDAFPAMECSTQRQQCKTKEDCNSAGRCEYHTEDHFIEQDGGICIMPFDLTLEEFDAYDPSLFRVWEQCEEEREDNLVGRWAHVGCALFNGNGQRRLMTKKQRFRGLEEEESDEGFGPQKGEDEKEFEAWEATEATHEYRMPTAGMNKENCPAGAKWFPHARTKSECAVPGYAWEANATGTMACCSEWGGLEGEEECWMFSQNTASIEACESCGGKWMSIFRFRREGQWVVGRWKKSYKWHTRALENKNVWMQTLAHWKLAQEWDKVVFAIRSGPTANLARCRGGSLLDFLQSIAKRENPTISLGTAELLPGVARAGKFGGVELTPSEMSIAVKTDIQLKKKPAAVSNTVSRRLRVGRKLLETIDTSTFGAACWSTVVNTEGLTIGQIVGDCITFMPDIALEAPVRICLPLNGKIALNPEFDVHDFGEQVEKTQVPLSKITTLGSGGNALCADIQESRTYCPIKRLSVFEGSSIVSRSNSCAEMEVIARIVSERSAAIKSSSDYLSLVQGMGFLLEGENAPDEDFGEGASFGLEGEMSDVNDIVEVLLRNETNTTTPAVETTPEPEVMVESSANGYQLLVLLILWF